MLSCASAHAASSCKLVKIVEWEVKPQGGRLVVDGAINGHKEDILLDTGAATSFVTRDAADRLGLPRNESDTYLSSTRSQSSAITGESRKQFATIDELKIGTAARKNWRALVLNERDLPYAFLLGYDFFEQMDIEFDLANNAVRVFQAFDCAGVPLAYWARGAGEVKLETDNENPGIVVAVKLNGKPFIAGLDTGASHSVVSRLLAANLGTFESFGIGDELIRNPTIGIANLEVAALSTGSRLAAAREPRDMLLGVDFLRAHRVLVAHSQRKVYFTYVGGPVFTSARP
ncbi:MAG: retroviral-like aspartic protease family protein [Betaproteobacteria bacterium]|nr:retroviral-like aspartic protease family protein [Betaproteobacteria bacterium]